MTGSLRHISQTHKPWRFTAAAAEVNQTISDNVTSRLMYVGTNKKYKARETLANMLFKESNPLYE